MASNTKTKERITIENYINKIKNRGISFAELEQELENNNINPKGDYWLPYKSCKNTYVWVNMSETFINAIISLLREFKIRLIECSKLIYLVDGVSLSLPIAIGKERDYKTEHWLPMLIYNDKPHGHKIVKKNKDIYKK
jgi:hypothetical protein